MKVAFIGGGIGAMTSALLLRRQGLDVTVFERGSRLGGRLAYEEGEGYKIDQGPTIVLLPETLLGIMEEAGISRHKLPLLPCDPMYNIHYADGTVLRKWRDTDRQAEELESLSPGAGKGFRSFMEDMRPLFQQGQSSLLGRPFLRRRDFFNWANLSLLLKFRAYSSVRKQVSRYFKDERIIDAYSLQTLYIGGAPFQSPSLYALLPYAEHAFGVWYLKGGYASLVNVMEEEMEKQGVAIYRNAYVEKIITKGRRCTGIVVGGDERQFDAVVYNGDFPHLSTLFPQGVKKPPVKSYKPSSGCVLLYLGLNRRYEDAAAHQFFLPDSLTGSLRRIFIEGRMPNDPSFYVFYPSAIDSDVAPDGESVMYMLIPAPPEGKVDWVTETPQLIAKVLEEAEKRGFPGLRDAIRWQSVRTPQDAVLEGLYQGGSFGIAPTLSQSALFRPQIVPYDIEGLYAVGASVHPGGGIPIVMQGARLLANQLLKERCSHGNSRKLG
ncbi:phytoene desaturase family protein [Paenibacillus chungangensis]|uniref:Phytoene desaturase family protein n=1 Tax=Paenibacillus chungangensis TaxID=696535 RepID=A0ABW3HLL7_9BACL